MNPNTFVIGIWRKNLLKIVDFFVFFDADLVISRANIHLVWNYPNLQKFYKLIFVFVVFAVHYTGSGAHDLNFSFSDHRRSSHGIFMFKIAFQRNRNNFHIAVRMRSETHSGSDLIVIQNP